MHTRGNGPVIVPAIDAKVKMTGSDDGRVGIGRGEDRPCRYPQEPASALIVIAKQSGVE